LKVCLSPIKKLKLLKCDKGKGIVDNIKVYDYKGVFGMSLLHSKIALLQNFGWNSSAPELD
jgi:hypothetical protein